MCGVLPAMKQEDGRVKAVNFGFKAFALRLSPTLFTTFPIFTYFPHSFKFSPFFLPFSSSPPASTSSSLSHPPPPPPLLYIPLLSLLEHRKYVPALRGGRKGREKGGIHNLMVQFNIESSASKPSHHNGPRYSLPKRSRKEALVAYQP